MRKINKTSLKVAKIFPLCYAHRDEKDDQNIKIKYANILHQIIHQEEEYERFANNGNLDLFPYLDSIGVESYGLTANDMKYLYTEGLVKGDGRQFYEELRNQTDSCPYCEINFPTTLDHVLEKTKSLGTTVTPINLVPACRICNEGKNVCKEVLWHPYYDEPVEYVWLYAEYLGIMGDNNEPCVKFYVSIPYEHKGERMAKKNKRQFPLFSAVQDVSGTCDKNLK